MDLSPLGGLPAELRNMIWEKAVYQPNKLILDVAENGKIRLQPGPVQHNVLALASVCKQSRTESISLFYSNNTFVLCTRAFLLAAENYQQPLASQTLWTAPLRSWFTCIGPAARKYIQNLQLDLGRTAAHCPPESNEPVAIAVRELLRALPLKCVTIRRRIYTPAELPGLRLSMQEWCIPLTSPSIASNTAKALLDDKLAQLDEFAAEKRLSSRYIGRYKNRTMFAYQRVEQFMRVATTRTS